jgi:hypothetical protein
LRAVDPVRAVKAHQLGVGRRVERGLDGEREGAVGRIGDAQGLRRRRVVARRKGAAIQPDREQRQLIAVEHEGGAGPPDWVWAQAKRRGDARLVRMKADVEFDAIDEVIRRAIILDPDGLRRVGAHV